MMHVLHLLQPEAQIEDCVLAAMNKKTSWQMNFMNILSLVDR